MKTSRSLRPFRLFAVTVLTLIAICVGSYAFRSSAAPVSSVIKVGIDAPAPADTKVSNLPKINLQPARALASEGLAAAASARGIDIASAEPLGLATDDLNGDGFPDLVCGYRTKNGGFLLVYLGDERAFAPKDESDIQNAVASKYAVPFRQAVLVPLAEAPDLIATGDFEHNSRRGILTAARGGQVLHFSTVAGDGTVSAPAERLVSGRISAIYAGSLDSSIMRTDLAVAVAGGEGPQVLVFDGVESVLDQTPLATNIPAEADSILAANLDSDSSIDLAMYGGGRVFILHGSDSKPERDGIAPDVRSGQLENVELPFAAAGLAVGDLIWDRDSQIEMAVASTDGGVHILTRGDLDTRPFTEKEASLRRQMIGEVRNGKRPVADLVRGRRLNTASWQVAEDASLTASLTGIGTRSIQPMFASGQHSIDLLALDPAGQKLSISYRMDALSKTPGRGTLDLPSTGEPIAALPMRLNIHSRPSIAVLQKGSIEPSLLFVAPETTFTVTKTADTNDGACDADCSLREAVVAANATAALDTISIPAGTYQLTRVGDDNTAANGDLDLNADVTITGAGSGSTRIQGSANGSFASNMGDKAFGINQDGTHTTLNVTIQNLTVRFTRNDITVNGNFTQTGGAMDVFLTGTGANPGPTTTLSNDVFDTNANSHSYGGALNIDSGDLASGTNIFRGTIQITGCTFSGNKTLTTSTAGTENPPTGGAINLFSDKHNVTISSSSITGNATSALVTATGGGINVRHSFGGNVTINSGTTITGNTSGSDGGGVMIAGAGGETFAMSGGSISTNIAQGTGDSAAGGGIFNANPVGSSALTGVTINANDATAGTTGTGGGVVDGSNSPMTIDSCTITNNLADFGGGVAVTNSFVSQLTTIQNSTSISSNTAASGGTGIYVVSGAAALSGTNSVTNDILIAGGTLTTNTASTTTLTGNFSESSGTFTGNNGAVNLTGNFTYTGGTFTAGTGTFNFNGSGSQSISNSSAITFANLTDSNTSANLAANNSFGVSGNLTVNASTTFAPAAAAVISGAGTLTGSGTAQVTRTTATADFLSQYTITNKTLTNLLVDYVGSAAQVISATTYGGLRLNNASGATVAAGTATVNQTLTLANGQLNVSTNTLTINNGTAVTSGTLTSSATGTVNYNQGSNGQSVLAGTYGNLSFSNFNKTLPAGTVNIAGTFTPGSGTPTVTGNTIVFNGSAAQTVPVFPYNNLTLNNSAGTTGAAALTVTGLTRTQQGTFSANGSFADVQIDIGSIFSANGAVNVGGNWLNNGTFTHNSNGVAFNGSGAQTITTGGSGAGKSFAAFSVNKSGGTATLAGALGASSFTLTAGTFDTSGSNFAMTTSGGMTLTAGTFNANGSAISLTGNWSNAAAFNAGTSTVTFNGGAAQSIGGTASTTFAGLTISNGAGVSLSTAGSVNGQLNLSAGEFSTGANTLTLGGSATSIRTTGFVVGTMKKTYTGNGAFTFMVGTTGAYSPVDTNVTAGTGSLTVTPKLGTAPCVPSLDATKTLQRYWTLSGTGITTDLQFNYLQGDVPLTSTEAAYYLIHVVGGTAAIGSAPNGTTVILNTVANFVKVLGVSTFSDWTAGERLAPVAANASIAGRVVDATGNGVGNVRVVVTDTHGATFNAITSPFGYYQVDGIEVGQTVVVTPLSKLYSYQPRTVPVSDSLSGVDFAPQ